MKKSKHLIILAILFVSTIFATQGQSTDKHKGKSFKGKTESADTRAKDFTDTLQKVLSLSTIQYEKVMFINKDFYSKRDVIRSTAKADTIAANKATYKQQTKALQKTRRDAIANELTEEQKTAWKIWRKQKAENKKANAKNAKKLNVDEDDEM